jgi:hypothetical protein
MEPPVDMPGMVVVIVQGDMGVIEVTETHSIAVKFVQMLAPRWLLNASSFAVQPLLTLKLT